MFVSVSEQFLMFLFCWHLLFLKNVKMACKHLKFNEQHFPNISNEIIFSVVMTIEISPPPRWLATTEPTPPPRCFTVFSAVFLGTGYCASVFRSAACSDSHLMPTELQIPAAVTTLELSWLLRTQCRSDPVTLRRAAMSCRLQRPTATPSLC